MLGEKGGNAAAFRQNDRRFRNYIMAWQEKGTHRGLLPGRIKSQGGRKTESSLLDEQNEQHELEKGMTPMD